MRRAPGQFFCPHERCCDRFRTDTARDLHAARPHVRCPHDQWVGVDLAAHVRARRRVGFDHPDVDPTE